MSERYFITGAQIGTIKALIKEGIELHKILDIMKDIEDEQFIGRMRNPYDDYEIVIMRKNMSELEKNLRENSRLLEENSKKIKKIKEMVLNDRKAGLPGMRCAIEEMADREGIQVMHGLL